MGLSTMKVDYSSKTYLEKLDAYWRATNYISVGQLYLKDNPLLREPLKDADIKIKPIGHWGTIPGQNFIYAHLNRVITKYDLNMFYVEGPGHGGQVMVSNSYLDGSYTEIYPEITQDIPGLKNCSNNSRSLAALLPMLHQKLLDLSMKAASWVILYPTALALFWITRI